MANRLLGNFTDKTLLFVLELKGMFSAVCFSLICSGLYCSGSIDGSFLAVREAMVFTIDHLAASLLGMLIVGAMLLPWILRKKKNTPSEDIHASPGHPLNDQLLQHHPTHWPEAEQADHSEPGSPQQLLTRKELSFLEFLYLNSLDGKLTSIAEINQFLGVVNRTADIQKRMRSDLISSINHKISVSAGLSQSVIDKKRSAFDKRSFDYFILKNHLDLVRSLVLAPDL